jgi:hypothetical protein
MTLFYATLEDWLGTRSYGPRYLVPLVPLVVSPLAVWFTNARTGAHRVLIYAICAVGVLVQLPAVAVDFSRAGIEAGQPPQLVRRDEWRWAPIRVNARAMLPAATASIRAFATNTPGAQTVAASSDSLRDRLPFGLDFWWVHLFQLGAIPRLVALLAAVVPLTAALWLLRFALVRASRVDAGNPMALAE